jgi:hypothetical protein
LCVTRYLRTDVGEDEENPKNESPDDENFKLGSPSDRTYFLKLEFASRYSPQAPVAITLDRDYANYQSTFALEQSVFTANRRLTIRLSELPPSRADDYRGFRNGWPIPHNHSRSRTQLQSQRLFQLAWAQLS